MGNPLRVRRPVAELAARGQVIEIAEKIGSFKQLAGIVEADLATLDPDKIPDDWRDSLVTGRLVFGFADAQMQVASLEGEVAVGRAAAVADNGGAGCIGRRGLRAVGTG
jgi:hypothetical protein